LLSENINLKVYETVILQVLCLYMCVCLCVCVCVRTKLGLSYQLRKEAESVENGVLWT